MALCGNVCETFLTFMFPRHFGVVRCTCLKIACDSKTSGLGAKGVKFGTEECQQHINIRDTFELVVVNVILVSFGALVSYDL